MASVILCFCIAGVYRWLVLMPNALSIEVVPPYQAEKYQLFYDVGHGFSKSDSLHPTIQPAEETVTITFFGVPFTHIQAFMFECGRSPEVARIVSIHLQHQFHWFGWQVPLYTWTGEHLAHDFQPGHGASAEFDRRHQLLVVTALEYDLSVRYAGDWSAVESAVASKLPAIKRYFYLLIGGIGMLIGLFSVEIVRLWKCVLRHIIKGFEEFTYKDQYRVSCHRIGAIVFIVLLGSSLRFLAMTRGHNFDYQSWKVVWYEEETFMLKLHAIIMARFGSICSICFERLPPFSLIIKIYCFVVVLSPS